MYRTVSYGTAGAHVFHADAKSERRYHENRKLYAMARDFVFSNPDMVVLGDDPVAEHLLSSAGFGTHDVAVLRIHSKRRIFTALCIPTRIWRDDEARAILRQVKTDARTIRTDCVLVPASAVRAPVRAAIARAVGRSRNISFSRRQRDRVMAHLEEARISTISEASSYVGADHDDPSGVILALASQGLVTFDRSRPLSPDTFISSRLPSIDLHTAGK